MNKYERIAFWLITTAASAVFLYNILPPVGWAVIALLLTAYGACEVAERAIRRAWRRR